MNRKDITKEIRDLKKRIEELESSLDDERELVLNDISANMDWEKIHKTMLRLEWVWSRCDGIPDEYEIRTFGLSIAGQAYDKLSEDLSHDTYTVVSGGFEAVAFKNSDDSISVELKFVVTSWTGGEGYE